MRRLSLWAEDSYLSHIAHKITQTERWKIISIPLPLLLPSLSIQYFIVGFLFVCFALPICQQYHYLLIFLLKSTHLEKPAWLNLARILRKPWDWYVNYVCLLISPHAILLRVYFVSHSKITSYMVRTPHLLLILGQATPLGAKERRTHKHWCPPDMNSNVACPCHLLPFELELEL